MTLGVVFCFLASFTFYFFTLLMIYSLYTLPGHVISYTLLH